jgi:hypothetical protein
VDGRNGKQGVGTELVDLKAHIFGISPVAVHSGESVTISGVNFGTNREQVVVTFDGFGAFVQSVSNTSIVVVVPFVPPRTASVRVRIAGTQVPEGVNLEVNLPRILAISPSIAEPGQSITISGRNFGTDLAQVVVVFDDFDFMGVVQSVSDTSIVLIVPSTLWGGTVAVRVKIGSTLGPTGADLEVTFNRILHVEGTYLNFTPAFQHAAQCDLTSVRINQTGSRVTVDLSAPSGECGRERPGWIFVGTLSVSGEFQASASTPACQQLTLALRFSETGYVGFVQCEDAGLQPSMPMRGFRD